MGETTFFGLPLLTARGHVMTPRTASEQLVVEALKRIGGRPMRVVDVGTGSGAIAVAIASAAPSADVWATDTSPDAVALAQANAQRHGVRVNVRHGDLIQPVPDPIDLVVANLPYLALADAARYPDLAGEPEQAVFGPGDGLEPYRRLLAACAERLDDEAAVMIQLHRRPVAATGAELRRHVVSPLLAAA